MKWHLAFSIIFLLVISWFLTNLVDWELASVAFLGADVWLVISGVVLTFFWPLVGTLRWRKVLSALSLEVPFSMAFKTVMIAFSTNIFVPAKSGDLVKVIAMS
ncbi:MAG: lysylphosphatidylglycerol synthase domain-containing protein, partial [Saprospiraceae bacterium]|nr:lysylphosphatidylglycerol synthase domain-containing protein [Saprospiraceae bacterium]